MTLHMDITKMVNTEITLTIFFAAEDGEALYSKQKCKKDQEVTVAQIINSLLPNSDLNWSMENHQTIQVWLKSNPLQLYSRNDK